ncbi:MAG: chemotaxis protein MotB [Planctomycetota bacterium]|jgi:chemotaxis protein MotB
MAKKPKPKEPKVGAPAYMVSFGDMMTLILCFFILLVSMAQERSFGMMAKGVGSFIVAVESHGLNGIMSGQEKEEVFEHVRRRFNLPPEEDPERREKEHEHASHLEIVTAEDIQAMEPHTEIRQPAVARFDVDSSTLDAGARSYLDRLSDSLRPRKGSVLRLEGHALDAGPIHLNDNQLLAFRRASAVRDYLVNELKFPAERVEARGWFQEMIDAGPMTRVVDTRLITPPASKD